MASTYRALTLQGTIAEKLHLLREFYVSFNTREVTDTITRLYPNDIAIENYIHTLIMNSLSK